jgi:dUTP pyrophosphatase
MENTPITFQNITYQLNIMICDENEQENLTNFYSKFNYHYDGDSGIDLYNNKLLIDSFAVGTLNFNIKCEMINLETNEYQSYYLVPRSSIAKTSFQLANSIGIIDAGYRGNLMAKVRNFNSKSEEYFPEGSYFQIISPDLKPIKIKIVTQLNESKRTTGFGSTNIKKN